MSLDPHYLWAAGHALTLVTAAKVALSTFLFRGGGGLAYKAAYTGALLSYGIVCLKSVGLPQSHSQGGLVGYLQKALMDENVQYLVLSAYWWISKPISLTLLPFATFSLFHVLTFIRTNILPKFSPPTPAAAGGASATPAAAKAQTATDKLGRAVQLWVKSNYDPAMKFVAYTELAIFARVALGAITFQNSLLAPLFFAHFLRLRYYHSAFTRQAVDGVTVRLDGLVAGQSPAVKNAYATAKGVVRKWAGSVLTKKQDGPVPAGVAAGAAGPAGARR